MINVGVIGLGVGAKHVRGYQRHPDCRVVTVCDLSETAAKPVMEAHPGIEFTTCADDVLKSNKIDAVSIASFDDMHATQVETALRHGKHVFVEKPLCLHPSEAERIRALLRDHPELRLSSNLNLRTCPRFQILRDRLSAGELGDIFYIEADYLWGRLEKLTQGWRGKLDHYSIILGASVHMVDLALWILRKRPVTVTSSGNRIVTANTGLKHHDFNVMLLQFDDGLIVKIMSSAGCMHPHFHRCIVYGTRETFVHDALGSGSIVETKADTPVRQIEGSYPAWERKDAVLHSFVDAIVGRDEMMVKEQDVFDALSVCFAAKEAAYFQKIVTINYL